MGITHLQPSQPLQLADLLLLHPLVNQELDVALAILALAPIWVIHFAMLTRRNAKDHVARFGYQMVIFRQLVFPSGRKDVLLMTTAACGVTVLLTDHVLTMEPTSKVTPLPTSKVTPEPTNQPSMKPTNNPT